MHINANMARKSEEPINWNNMGGKCEDLENYSDIVNASIFWPQLLLYGYQNHSYDPNLESLFFMCTLWSPCYPW